MTHAFVQWLKLWEPCEDLAAFDILAQQPKCEVTFRNELNCEVTNDGNKNADPFPYIAHGDVCEPAYIGDGRCPRAVVSPMSPSRVIIIRVVADQRAWLAALQEADLWCGIRACYCTFAFLSCMSHDTSMVVQEAVTQAE